MNLTLTPQQLSALNLVDVHLVQMGALAAALGQLGADSLARAVGEAGLALKAAHGAYVAETQRTIAVASPADVKRLVVSP